MEGEENILDVWLLKQDQQLDFEELKWNTRPERSQLLGQFLAVYGTTQQLVGFPCVSGTYLTIEIACNNSNCAFDLVARQKKAMGVYVQQHQTI